jgi:hypothetical protein
MTDATDFYLHVLAHDAIQTFESMDRELIAEFGSAKPRGHRIDTTQMPFAPRVLLYAGKLGVETATALGIFGRANILIDIVDQSELFKTVFVSYGGPDAAHAAAINEFLKARGVNTWFFPKDARVGDKLHRVMHEGVNKYDRVLLVCSEAALSRPGVLNEIERVLEREAREGGSDILLPVTLDDFVFDRWKPDRPDIAQQVRARVIAYIRNPAAGGVEAVEALNKLVDALSHGR